MTFNQGTMEITCDIEQVFHTLYSIQLGHTGLHHVHNAVEVYRQHLGRADTGERHPVGAGPRQPAGGEVPTRLTGCPQIGVALSFSFKKMSQRSRVNFFRFAEVLFHFKKSCKGF